MAGPQKAIEVDGLKDFRDGLRLMGPAYVKELRLELKHAGEVVRAGAMAKAPVGTRPKSPKARGAAKKHLRDTIVTRVAGDKVSIFSPSPYANLTHWGGYVPNGRSPSRRPKRKFAARKFIVKSVDEHSEQFQKDLLDAVGTVARRHGWQ